MTLRNPIVGEALVPEGQGVEGPHGPGVPLGRQGHTRRSHRDKGERGPGAGRRVRRGDAPPRHTSGQASRHGDRLHGLCGASVLAGGGGRTQPTGATILSSWRQTTHWPGSSSAPPLLGGFRFRPELPPFFLSPLLSPQSYIRGGGSLPSPRGKCRLKGA